MLTLLTRQQCLLWRVKAPSWVEQPNVNFVRRTLRSKLSKRYEDRVLISGKPCVVRFVPVGSLTHLIQIKVTPMAYRGRFTEFRHACGSVSWSNCKYRDEVPWLQFRSGMTHHSCWSWSRSHETHLHILLIDLTRDSSTFHLHQSQIPFISATIPAPFPLKLSNSLIARSTLRHYTSLSPLPRFGLRMSSNHPPAAPPLGQPRVYVPSGWQVELSLPHLSATTYL